MGLPPPGGLGNILARGSNSSCLCSRSNSSCVRSGGSFLFKKARTISLMASVDNGLLPSADTGGRNGNSLGVTLLRIISEKDTQLKARLKAFSQLGGSGKLSTNRFALR